MYFSFVIYLAAMSGSMLGLDGVHERSPDTRIIPDTTTSGATDTTKQIPRLTVRPREMATGMRTAQAGLTILDGLPGYYLYIPPQCVGKKRSPLIVLLHGGGRSGLEEVTKFRGLADTYGMIILAGSSVQPGLWDVSSEFGTPATKTTLKDGSLIVSAFTERDVRNLDTAIKRVLRTQAIDPDRIALMGFSDGGSYSLFLGLSNLDVFSRIAPLSAMIPFDGIGPSNPKTQFFLSGGLEEKIAGRTLRLARKFRQRGHLVMTQIGLRNHVDQVEDEYFVWAWLQQSWADPTTTARVPKEVYPDLLLTDEILQLMTAFWRGFQQLPDSIRNGLRMKHQIQLPLTIGSERTTVITMDIPAMAAVSPAVVAILDSIGLKAETVMAYRTAITRAGIARSAGMKVGTMGQENDPAKLPVGSPDPIDPTSILGRNLEYWKSHSVRFIELEENGILSVQ